MVWGFVGAIGTTIMIYILPPAFYLRVRIHPPRPDLKQIAAWGLMLTGLAVLIVCTYQSFANVINPIPKAVRPHGLSNSTLHGTVSSLVWIDFEEPLKQNIDDWWMSCNTFLNTWRSYVTVYPSRKSVKNKMLWLSSFKHCVITVKSVIHIAMFCMTSVNLASSSWLMWLPLKKLDLCT